MIDATELEQRLAQLEPSIDRRAVAVVRAPGRVNLIGEYTDINEGFVLPAAIDLEIRIAFARTGDRRVILHRLDTHETGQFDLDALPAASGSWIDYAVGTAWALAGAGLAVHGVRGVIASTLPVGSGLSSSAAIEMAVAHALLGDGADRIDPVRLAQLGQRAENEFVGVKSGLMDQFASNCGREDAALLLDTRTLDWRAAPLPEDISLVVVDSGSRHELTSSAYNDRRAECLAAVEFFQQADPSVRALRDVTPADIASAERAAEIDPVIARRARHIVTENERVHATVAALEAGDVAGLGEIFAASHASMRDDFEISVPPIDVLVDIATNTPGVVASRLTGAGFGGCTINLVRPDAIDRLRAAVEARYPAETGLQATVYPVRAVKGAELLGGPG